MSRIGRPPKPTILDQVPWSRGRFWCVAYFLDVLNIHWKKEGQKSKGSKGGRPSSRGLKEIHQLRDEICRRFKLNKNELKELVQKEEKLRIKQKEEEDRNFRRMLNDERCWTPWEGF